MQTFILFGISMKIENIGQITGFSQTILYNLKKYIIERGYNYTIIPIIYNIYINNI